MARSNVSLVQKMYECLGNGELETLRQEIFAPDVEWNVPGRHPLAGSKQNINEVIYFLDQLAKSGLQVEVLRMDEVAKNRVVELHRVYGDAKGVSLDALTVSDYQIQDGKITRIQDYLYHTHEMDHFFHAIYALKPIPERLAS